MSIGSGSDGPTAKDRYAGLAALLRERREQLGLTRKDVCERTGLSYPYVSQLEGGYRAPSLSTARKLAQALGLAVQDIVVLADDAPGAPPPAPRPGAARSYANPSFAMEAVSSLPGPDPDPVPDLWSAPAPASGLVAAVASLGERPRARRPPAPDAAVAAAAELLAGLPPEQRLDALAAVQRQVVESMVRDTHTGAN